MREEEIVASVFNLGAEGYCLSFSTVFDQFLAGYEKKRILEEFTDTKGLLLDVGTGWGRYAIELTKMGLDVVGMDISRKMLETALVRRERASKHHIVQAEALRLPFKDNSFDSVLFVRSFKYIKDYFIALDEVSRVLRYKGKLVIYDVGNIYTLNHLYHLLYNSVITNKKTDDPLPYYKFSIFSLKKYLQGKGFFEFKVNGSLHIPRRFYKKISNERYLKTVFKIEEIIDMGLPSGLFGYAFILSAIKKRWVTEIYEPIFPRLFNAESP